MDYHNAEAPDKMLDDLEAKHGSSESAGSDSPEAFARCLARHGVIDSGAVDDSECFDNYDTMNKCRAAFRELWPNVQD